MSECYVLRDEPCEECGSHGLVYTGNAGHYCRCTFSGGGIGVTQVRIPLIDAPRDALRELGIDVSGTNSEVRRGTDECIGWPKHHCMEE